MKKKIKNKNNFSKLTIAFLMLSLALITQIKAQAPHSHEHDITFPDIPGYKTLKGDFHQHTVFSDGVVWPHIRVDEAIAEGLDVISITDHVEKHRKVDIDNQNN